MKLEALKHIDTSNFDQLVRNKCLYVAGSDTLAANVDYFSIDIREKLENRARLFSREVVPHEKFETLVEIAIREAVDTVVGDSARLDFETLYLQGLAGDGTDEQRSMFLGAVEVTVRKNPKIDVTDRTGTVINENAKVRLSSAMLLFGAIATAARISLRTPGEEEVWDSNLDMAIGMQYALDLARSNVVIRRPLNDVSLLSDIDI